MSIKDLLFSFKGRVNRRTFWLWNAFYYLSILTVASLVAKLFPVSAGSILPVFLVVMVIPDLAITAKRWHDRNKSNMYLLLTLPVIAGRFSVPMGDAMISHQPTTLETLVSIVALVCGSWILVECGFLKGDAAENRYGSPQL